MTNRELSDWLLTLTNDQLDFMDVTIYDPWFSEFYGISEVKFSSERNDVVGANHPVIVLDMGS